MIGLATSLALIALQQTAAENQVLRVERVALDATASSRIYRTALTVDASQMVKGGSEGEVVVSSVSTGAVVWQSQVSGNAAQWVGTPHERWASGMAVRVTGLEFSPAGDALYYSIGDGTLARVGLPGGVLQFSIQLGFPVSAIAMNDAGTRLLVGSPRGRVEEFDITPVGAPQYIRAIRGADGAGAVHAVAYFDGDQKIFSSLRGYHLADDAENGTGSPGAFVNAGPTVWSASSGVRLLRFGGPEGTADMTYNAGTYYFGTSDRNSAVFSSAGVLLRANSFDSGKSLGLLQVPGLAAPVVASLRGKGISFVTTTAGEEELMDYPALSKMSVGTLSTATSVPRVSVGFSSGEAAVYALTYTGPVIRSNPQSENLGQIGGYSIDTTEELLGHESRIEEVCVSDAGNFIASRSADGEAVLWVKGGSGPFGGSSLAVNLAGCWDNQNVFAFDSAETQLVTVDGSGVLRVTSLATPALPPTQISVTSGGAPFEVVSALPVPGGGFIVGGRDGSLRRTDSLGVVQHTMVGPLPSSDHMTPPFTFLLRAPNNTHYLAAPTSVFRDASIDHKATVFSFSNNNSVATLGGRYIAAQFACVGSSSFVVADCGEAMGAAFVNSNTLAQIDGARVGIRDGVGCFQPGYALGFDGRNMSAVWLTGSTLNSQTWLLPWASPVSAVGSPLGGGIIVTGLESGRLVVIQGT